MQSVWHMGNQRQCVPPLKGVHVTSFRHAITLSTPSRKITAGSGRIQGQPLVLPFIRSVIQGLRYDTAVDCRVRGRGRHSLELDLRAPGKSGTSGPSRRKARCYWILQLLELSTRSFVQISSVMYGTGKSEMLPFEAGASVTRKSWGHSP